MGKIGIKSVKDVIRMKRLGWFGNVERRDEMEWIKRVLNMKVEGKRPAGRPKKPWSKQLRRIDIPMA